jgi:hypothetical protein
MQVHFSNKEEIEFLIHELAGIAKAIKEYYPGNLTAWEITELAAKIQQNRILNSAFMTSNVLKTPGCFEKIAQVLDDIDTNLSLIEEKL